MVQANNNGVTYDIGVSVEKAVADLARGEARLVRAVQETAARASKVARVSLGMDFNEAAVRKRMAELIKDMKLTAAQAQIEMEARVRLFGPDGQTPLDQWAKKSIAFGGNGVWQQGAKGGRLESMIGSGGVSGGGGGGGIGGGASRGGIADLLGKRSDLKGFAELLRGGGMVVGLTLALDALGRMAGQMRQVRDDIRLGEKSAGDMAQAFGRSIPVLGKIVDLGGELREMITSENFDLARTLETRGIVESVTQQIAQLRREGAKAVAEIDRRNTGISRDIGVLQTGPGATRADAQAKAALTLQIENIDVQIKQQTEEIKKKYRDLLKTPFDATLDPNLKIPQAVAAQLRSVSLEQLEREAKRNVAEAEGKANELQGAGSRLVDITTGDSPESRAADARRSLRDVQLTKRLIESEATRQENEMRDALEEQKKRERERADVEKARRDQDDTSTATGIRMYQGGAVDARMAGDIQRAERLEFEGQLAERVAAVGGASTKAGKEQIETNKKLLADFKARQQLAREEIELADQARLKAAQQRQQGDVAGAERTERDARNSSELRAMKASGATPEAIALREQVQSAEGAATANQKRVQGEISVARSITDIRQAELRASQRYYDSEVYAIEQAYAEQLRIAETSEDKMTAITVAENQKRARMIELNAQTEQRAKDAGFEANQIRLRREGKETEAQRAAIMRQAQDELKQVGDNANARDAIFERTRQQLLELQDAEGMRRGVGSWVADSIYSTAPNRPRTDTLNETNQNELLKLLPNRAGDFYPTALGAGIASALQAVPKDSRAGGIFGMAQDMVALMQSEVAAMNQASKPVKTDADSKVEIRGEVVTLLRQVAENTGKATTAVFAP